MSSKGYVTICFRVPQEYDALLRVIAERRFITLSQLLRSVIRSYLGSGYGKQKTV